MARLPVHVYPYYPDYLNYFDFKSGFAFTEDGRLNTYLEYLKRIVKHHSMPVVISEYGVSTGRGMAQRDYNTGRNQGNMSENEQGQAIIDCYNDIMEAGCAGSCIFTWQDEWFYGCFLSLLVEIRDYFFFSSFFSSVFSSVLFSE